MINGMAVPGEDGCGVTYRHGTGPLAKQVRVVAEVINEPAPEVAVDPSTVREHCARPRAHRAGPGQ
nr:hypothetical protein GCM10020241_16250 [Streptoalloteichus tenebrarius]